MRDNPRIGCTSSGDELLAVGQALRDAVGEHLVERERVPGGLRLRVARHPGAADALHAYARKEKACCSFFDITVADDGDTVSLTVTGPPETAGLVDLLYQLAGPATVT